MTPRPQPPETFFGPLWLFNGLDKTIGGVE